MNLNNYKHLTKEQLPEWLNSLTEGQLESVKGQQEGYLLCYPQGTGDEQLEDLLNNLDELLYPECYENREQELLEMRLYQQQLKDQQTTN